MAGLMDMEELLARISNPDVVGYMREATKCYGAGAYRGCIVLSYIALFDDMRAKLSQLSTINKTARSVHTEVEKRANDQDVFESFMWIERPRRRRVSPLNDTPGSIPEPAPGGDASA